ncbi:MAG TPA: four helix bundle protein [Gemmatimonadaceae bacterium]|nr:four helix bundle protein [Gemmatimonadaceae bacterium]
MQDHTRLIVYRDAYALALSLERLLAGAPRGFASKRTQLLDAAWSISANIAEGCGASTQSEMARFLDVAMKSAKELEHHLRVACDVGALSASEHDRNLRDLELVRRRLYRFIQMVRRTPDRPR